MRTRTHREIRPMVPGWGHGWAEPVVRALGGSVRRGSTLVGAAMLLAILASTARAQIVDLDLGDDPGVITSDDRHEARLAELEPRQNRAFGVGERMLYSVRYGFVRAGECRLEVLPEVSVNGRPCYKLVGTAQSSDFFSSVFRVDDRLESYLDTELLLPWRSAKVLHEGGYHADQRVELDQVNRMATYHDGTTVPLDPGAQDILSVLYHIRTLDLRPGFSDVIRVHADEKNVDLEVRVLGREEVDTPGGTFRCLAVEPLIRLDTGLYDSEKGKLVMYVTDDARKLPVMFKIKVFFGSIVLTLTDLVEGSAPDGSVP